MTREERLFIEDTLEQCIDWASYADEYFQKKHRLEDDFKNIDKCADILKTSEAETTQLKQRVAELEAEVLRQKKWGMQRRDDAHRFNSENKKLQAELQELKSGVVAEFEGQLCGEGDAVPFFHNNEWLISDLLENHQNKHIIVTIKEKKQ